jgi:hypothetical protein
MPNLPIIAVTGVTGVTGMTGLALALAPPAVGALALARLVYEIGRKDERGMLPALAAILSLGAYLIMLPADASRAALLLAAATAVALWLQARALRQRRLLPLWCFFAGCLVGTRPWLMLALAPLFIVARPLPDEPAKAWARAGLVVAMGAALGRAVFYAPLTLAAPGAAARWLFAAQHHVGVGALVLAALSFALVFVGEGRRQLAFVAAALLALDAAAGTASTLTALAVAITLALGLLEAGVRLEATSRQGRPLPGASLLFAPLVLVALLEPLATRLVGAHLAAPTFGPVPPDRAIRDRRQPLP